MEKTVRIVISIGQYDNVVLMGIAGRNKYSPVIE